MQGRLQTQDDHVSEPLDDGIRAVSCRDWGAGGTDMLIVAIVCFVHEHSSVLGYNLQSSLHLDVLLQWISWHPGLQCVHTPVSSMF